MQHCILFQCNESSYHCHETVMNLGGIPFCCSSCLNFFGTIAKYTKDGTSLRSSSACWSSEQSFSLFPQFCLRFLLARSPYASFIVSLAFFRATVAENFLENVRMVMAFDRAFFNVRMPPVPEFRKILRTEELGTVVGSFSEDSESSNRQETGIASIL